MKEGLSKLNESREEILFHCCPRFLLRDCACRSEQYTKLERRIIREAERNTRERKREMSEGSSAGWDDLYQSSSSNSSQERPLLVSGHVEDHVTGSEAAKKWREEEEDFLVDKPGAVLLDQLRQMGGMDCGGTREAGSKLLCKVSSCDKAVVHADSGRRGGPCEVAPEGQIQMRGGALRPSSQDDLGQSASTDSQIRVDQNLTEICERAAMKEGQEETMSGDSDGLLGLGQSSSVGWAVVDPSVYEGESEVPTNGQTLEGDHDHDCAMCAQDSEDSDSEGVVVSVDQNVGASWDAGSSASAGGFVVHNRTILAGLAAPQQFFRLAWRMLVAALALRLAWAFCFRARRQRVDVRRAEEMIADARKSLRATRATMLRLYAENTILKRQINSSLIAPALPVAAATAAKHFFPLPNQKQLVVMPRVLRMLFHPQTVFFV